MGEVGELERIWGGVAHVKDQDKVVRSETQRSSTEFNSETQRSSTEFNSSRLQTYFSFIYSFFDNLFFFKVICTPLCWSNLDTL